MTRRHNVQYATAGGVVTDLNSWPYRWDSINLHDYDWGYSLTRKTTGYGSRISDLTKEGRAYDVTLLVYNTDQSVITTALNALHAIFEAAVLAQQPGRLYVDGQYVTGYFLSSKKAEYTDDKAYIRLALQFVTGSPFWTTDAVFTFPTYTPSGGGWILPSAMPMWLDAGLSGTALENDHFAASNALIKIFGAATDPEFYVGSTVYKILGTIAAGDRVEIDQANRTVTYISSTGARANWFDHRNKVYSVFTPIPAGSNTLYYDGSFAIEVTLYQERSEPLWS